MAKSPYTSRKLLNELKKLEKESEDVPNSDDIEKIIENPANWVVVPLLFKECDD